MHSKNANILLGEFIDTKKQKITKIKMEEQILKELTIHQASDVK
jgi:hypothetical protein